MLHVEPPSVELTALPSYSTATQSSVPGAHEIELKTAPLSATVVVHFPAPPVGSVDQTALPLWSTATQSGAEVQETDMSVLLPSTLTALLQLDPPLIDVKTFPSPFTATHKDVDGHDTPKRLLGLMLTGALHAPLPPVGFVDLRTLPLPSTATHNEVLGHETAKKKLLPASMLAPLHAEAPPVGLVEVTMFPDWSTAAHRDADGHETPSKRPFVTSTETGPDQFKEAPAASAAGTPNGSATKTRATNPSQCQDRRKVGERLLRYRTAIKSASNRSRQWSEQK